MHSRALRSAVAALLALVAAPGAAAGATLQVTGLVKGAGRATTEVAVELLPLPGGPQPAPPPVRATAGPDGTFTLQAAAPGLYRVVVSAPGHQSIEVPLVPLVEDAELVPAALRREGERFRPDHTERLPGDRSGPPVWVSAGHVGPAAAAALRKRGERGPGAAIAPAGRVLDAATRQPLAGALVWCASCEPFGWAFAGPDGTFRFATAPYERYQIEAAAAGHLAALVGDAVPAQPTTLLLEPAAALAGIVVDAAGRPVAGVAVRARPSGEWDSRHSPRDASPRAASGADGRFRFPRLLPRQLYEVSAHPEEHAPARLVARTPPPGGKAPPLRLVLAPGQTVVGRVVDPDGKPVAAADVSLRRVQRSPGMGHGLTSGGPGPSAATGADGRFRFHRVETGEYDLQVTRRGFAAGDRGALTVLAQKSDVDLGDVVLEPGVVLEGRVVGPKGVPVAGAEVWPWPDTTPFERSPVWHEPVTTDAEGAFRLADLRRGERVQLSVSHPAYAPLEGGEVEVPTEEPLMIELRPQGTLALRVVDPEGEPVPGAEVSSIVETRVSTGQGVFSQGYGSEGIGKTDAEGNLLAHPAPGAYLLEVSAAGFETRRVPGVEVPAGDGPARPLEVVLRRGAGATLIGRLTDHAGQPLPGFRVQAVPRLEDAEEAPFGRHRAATTQTDADGAYRLEGLHPGRYEVEAHGRRQRMAHGTVRLAAGTVRLDLVVEEGVEVSGRIVDAAGQPVGGAAAWLQTLPGGSTFQSASAADGSFVFDWVPDGTYQLSAGAHGYARAVAPGELQVAGVALDGLEVRLRERSGAISGQVLGLDPAQRSRVQVRAHQLDSGLESSVVGPDGRYRIVDLAPGEWQVIAAADDGRQASGQVTLEPGQPEAFLDLELEARPTLAGRATFDGRPLAGADVRLSGAGAAGGQTALDGSFRFGLTPGRYTLILLDPRQGLGYSREVEVGLEGAEVTIDLESTSLSGRVLDGGGAPVAGAAVVAEGVNPALDLSYSGPATRTDEAGLFALRLAPGHYRLTVSADGFAPATAEVELPEGRTVELEVPLAPAAEDPT
jgi:protocatechuate 3,4-dioxygenase beta subunit